MWQNTNKLYGAKNNCVHAQLGQILDKRSKETEKPNCHFWRAWSKTGCQEQNWVSGTKAEYWACPLHTSLPEGWADHLRHPAVWPPGHTPVLTALQDCFSPPRGAGESVVCSLSQCCRRSCSEVSPEFIIWPLINSCWSRRPRTLAGNRRTLVALGRAHPDDLILAWLDLQKPHFQIRALLRFCEFELQLNFVGDTVHCLTENKIYLSHSSQSEFHLILSMCCESQR